MTAAAQPASLPEAVDERTALLGGVRDSAPEYLEYDPNQPAVPGYSVESYHPRGPFIAGSITFGVGYGLSLLGAATGSSDKDFNANWLFLPVLGPFIGMATQHETCTLETTPTKCGHDSGTLIVLGALGTMQVVGAGLFTWGLTWHRLRQKRVGTAELTVVPVRLGARAYGLAATGVF